VSGGPGPEDAFQLLTSRIGLAGGLDVGAYKTRCLRRRIAVRMRARGAHTYAEYRALLDRDPDEYHRLLDALTINVTRFFRNPEAWNALSTRLLPILWRERRGRVRAWSAGCASGEEAYTLAIALAESAREAGSEGWLDRARIDATDIDPRSLERARCAVYDAPALAEMPASLRARYFPGAPPSAVPGPVRKLVHVLEHDLIRDPAPRPPYDVILCRNTVIYFDRPTQERLFLLFADALAPGGLLVLGKVETLVGEARQRLTLLDARERIYCREQ
jgi:chemotaxis methyl-accepting protein methylase